MKVSWSCIYTLKFNNFVAVCGSSTTEFEDPKTCDLHEVATSIL